MSNDTYTATTDERGEATFEELPPGGYEVEVDGVESVEVERL